MYYMLDLFIFTPRWSIGSRPHSDSVLGVVNQGVSSLANIGHLIRCLSDTRELTANSKSCCRNMCLNNYELRMLKLLYKSTAKSLGEVKPAIMLI